MSSLAGGAARPPLQKAPCSTYPHPRHFCRHGDQANAFGAVDEGFKARAVHHHVNVDGVAGHRPISPRDTADNNDKNAGFAFESHARGEQTLQVVVQCRLARRSRLLTRVHVSRASSTTLSVPNMSMTASDKVSVAISLSLGGRARCACVSASRVSLFTRPSSASCIFNRAADDVMRALYHLPAEMTTRRDDVAQFFDVATASATFDSLTMGERTERQRCALIHGIASGA